MCQGQRPLATAKGHSPEALFVLALMTDVRRGELQALKWNRFSLQRHRPFLLAQKLFKLNYT